MEMVGIVVVLMLFRIAMTTAEGLKEAEEWFHEYMYNNTPSVTQQRVTQLHFYFQDLRGVNRTLVARPNTADASPTSFGELYAIDTLLTVGPSQASKVIGRAQALYCSTSMEKRSFTMAMALVFTNGPFNGSSLTVLGDNPALLRKRELPVVGGSGVFRLASGVALLNNYFFDLTRGNVTVEYNVTVHHN